MVTCDDRLFSSKQIIANTFPSLTTKCQWHLKSVPKISYWVLFFLNSKHWGNLFFLLNHEFSTPMVIWIVKLLRFQTPTVKSCSFQHIRPIVKTHCKNPFIAVSKEVSWQYLFLLLHFCSALVPEIFGRQMQLWVEKFIEGTFVIEKFLVKKSRDDNLTHFFLLDVDVLVVPQYLTQSRILQ